MALLLMCAFEEYVSSWRCKRKVMVCILALRENSGVLHQFPEA
jgi:hypothetical protein